MTATLPARWREDHIAVVAETSCWLWTGPTAPWYARAAIAKLYRAEPGGDCGISPHGCVSPMHGPATTRPAGAAS